MYMCQCTLCLSPIRYAQLSCSACAQCADAVMFTAEAQSPDYKLKLPVRWRIWAQMHRQTLDSRV